MGVKNPEKHRTPFIDVPLAQRDRETSTLDMKTLSNANLSPVSPSKKHLYQEYISLDMNMMHYLPRILLRSDEFKKFNLYTIFSLKKGFAFVFGLDFRYYVLTCLSNFSCNLSKIDLCETVRLKTKFDSVVSLRIYRKDSNWYLLVPNFGSLQL